jgi:hypothetical protein
MGRERGERGYGDVLHRAPDQRHLVSRAQRRFQPLRMRLDAGHLRVQTEGGGLVERDLSWASSRRVTPWGVSRHDRARWMSSSPVRGDR